MATWQSPPSDAFRDLGPNQRTITESDSTLSDPCLFPAVTGTPGHNHSPTLLPTHLQPAVLTSTTP